MREGGHQVLAVEPIHDAAVSGDGAGKVLQQNQTLLCLVGDTRVACENKKKDTKRYLYFEGSLKAAGEEATKGPDERRKGGEEDAVDLEGVEVHRFLEETTADMRAYFDLFLSSDIKSPTSEPFLSGNE